MREMKNERNLVIREILFIAINCSARNVRKARKLRNAIIIAQF